MTPVTDRSFGLLIAYVIPGFSAVVLWGRSFHAVARWLAESPQSSPTVGGFLYVTIASTTVGLVLSTVRWAVLDRLHHATGVVPPEKFGAATPVDLDLYRLIVDLHYRYYQFYGSCLLVVVMCLLVPPAGVVAEGLSDPVHRLGLIAVAMLFFAASRDTLSKCYRRSESCSRPFSQTDERSSTMTNGGHYGTSHATSAADKKVNTAKDAQKSDPRKVKGDMNPDQVAASDNRAEVAADKE